MTGLALVHLVRRQNGIVPFARFLDSYRAHPAGVGHELVIVFKGFPAESGIGEHDALLKELPHRKLFMADRGFDLSAYFTAVARFDSAYFCFVNSFSRILDDGWLRKLYDVATGPDVGIVGATGSAQSIVGGYTDQQKKLNSLPPISRFRTRVGRVLADPKQGSLTRRAMFWALRSAGIWRPERDFPHFPNYHLRTNVFMGRRTTLSRIRLGSMRTKLSAYRFESGNDSLTRQIQKFGLQVLVVGRDGEAYEPERWHLSNTFWQSRQENLLVTDNQTEAYRAADSVTRFEMAQNAWGASARP